MCPAGMKRAITELPVRKIFLVGSLENVVKKARTINLKASGIVPNFKEYRGILAKEGPSLILTLKIHRKEVISKI